MGGEQADHRLGKNQKRIMAVKASFLLKKIQRERKKGGKRPLLNWQYIYIYVYIDFKFKFGSMEGRIKPS